MEMNPYFTPLRDLNVYRIAEKNGWVLGGLLKKIVIKCIKMNKEIEILRSFYAVNSCSFDER
ncbi:MAG: hypothetical protein CK425_12440 [Parachlamydia sp.]|nr:MAG: hypothetical protein CK425_12440 [Parachlamydia sp.]